MAAENGSRLRRVAGEAARRFASKLDVALFPEADGPADHWQRLVMAEAVDSRLAELGTESSTAAEISGDTHATRPWREYASLNYPEFDLCAPLTVGRRFDVVICEQVIEHVPDPWGAVANLRGLCEPGGLVIVSTPFLVRVHEMPIIALEDYWRFTPRGMRTLLESAGLEVESIGSWGNRECVVGNFNRWPRRRAWHAMRNEPDFPVQVWGFARNPADGS